MNQDWIDRYATLISDYCLDIRAGNKVLIRANTLAEPLLQALYIHMLDKGAIIETDISFEDQDIIYYHHASDAALEHVSTLYSRATTEFDAILNIRSPYNTKSARKSDPEKRVQHLEALKPFRETFFKRAATKDLKWCLCVFPSHAMAQDAGKSRHEYKMWLEDVCFLNEEDPIQAWKNLSDFQHKWVERFNGADLFEIEGPNTQLSLSTKDRIWINSDGRRNMPSGEIFTSPVENSLNGHIHFDVPTIYDSQDVEGVTLTIENGVVQTWQAETGQNVLDTFFAKPGARMCGEFAIGTNPRVKEPTRNILFDEKIAGTLHMAFGSSYPETGGKNQSPVHWDMIKWMTDPKARIKVDGQVVYQAGAFI